ncbi:hypothetical protein E2542_SST29833 [Spatholobus suberectus]|nr:hypothetical protein E2542_SST29833 [Spatholobus suberectus]
MGSHLACPKSLTPFLYFPLSLTPTLPTKSQPPPPPPTANVGFSKYVIVLHLGPSVENAIHHLMSELEILEQDTPQTWESAYRYSTNMSCGTGSWWWWLGSGGQGSSGEGSKTQCRPNNLSSPVKQFKIMAMYLFSLDPTDGKRSCTMGDIASIRTLA